VIVYLWESSGPARNWLGISGNREAARRAVRECLRSGDTTAARVEEAITVIGARTLSHAYEPTGNGWVARLGKDGRVRWTPLRENKRGTRTTRRG
jgi:hypothetical protein